MFAVPANDASGVVDELSSALKAWVAAQHVPAPTPARPWAVALSGGVDSVVLLRVANGLWPKAVVGLHVNHGLQAAAFDFEQTCLHLCQDLGTACHVAKAHVAMAAGDSVEERARQVRYHWLGQLACAHNIPMVLLAQHADDQLETVLLAMLRGSGVAGLAGMPSVFKRHGVRFGRPFLHVAKQSIEQCAGQAQWPFVPDPSNQDKKLTRNLLRHEVVPILKQCFPHALSTVGRVAEHCADAHGLMQEMAEQDWVSIGAAPLIEPMQQLPVQRQSQLIRHWFFRMGQRAPSTVQLRELQKQIAACTTRGHQIRVKAGAGYVMRKNNALIFVADL